LRERTGTRCAISMGRKVRITTRSLAEIQKRSFEGLGGEAQASRDVSQPGVYFGLRTKGMWRRLRSWGKCFEQASHSRVAGRKLHRYPSEQCSVHLIQQISVEFLIKQLLDLSTRSLHNPH